MAYGAESDWNALTEAEQNALLAQDNVLRERGDLVAAVETAVTSVRAWDGDPVSSNGPFAASSVPLAGFGIIDAADSDEAVRLVADTPCARARGFVELRPILSINDSGPYGVQSARSEPGRS